MPVPKDTPVILHRRFDDFDAMTDATRHWDLDFLQLDRGPFEGEVLQAAVGSVFFTEGRFSRRLEQRGVATTGTRTYAIPAHECVRFIWHMGQFATDYRKQFGELPSQTLAARSE